MVAFVAAVTRRFGTKGLPKARHLLHKDPDLSPLIVQDPIFVGIDLDGYGLFGTDAL